MKLEQFIEFLNTIAPSYLQEEYDNAGLIVGDPTMNIKGVLVCLDAIEDVVDEAISLGCNVILAHHPIIFRGLKKLNGSNYVERTVIKAIKNDIAIMAIHTNLDNVYISGVNTKIAQKIGLTDVSILFPKSDALHNNNAVGAGVIGNMPVAMDCNDFLEHLKRSMALQTFRFTSICRNEISKVALCGGSGGFLLQEAKRQKADIFITSDFKYHEFFDADGQIIIADIGHFESEKFTIELLYDLIINNFSTFAAHCTKIITNPIKYF